MDIDLVRSDTAFRDWMDINKDGVLDELIGKKSFSTGTIGNHHLSLSVRPTLPLLTKVITPLQAETSFEYTPASSYLDENKQNLNPDLPMPWLTVSKMIVNEGFQEMITEYTYEGGKLYYPLKPNGAFEKEYLGFAKVTKKLPSGGQIVSEYAQGRARDSFATKGLLKREFVLDENEQVLQEKNNFYEVVEVNNDAKAVQLVKSSQTTHEPKSLSNFIISQPEKLQTDLGNYGELLTNSNCTFSKNSIN